MGNTIGVVSVILSAKDENLAKGFEKAKKTVGEFSSIVQRTSIATAGLGTAGGAISTLASAFKSPVGAATALAAAVGAVALAGKQYAEQLDEVSDRTGLTAANVAMLNRASVAAGIGTDGLTQSFERMNVIVGQALSGNEAAAKSLNDIGVHLADIRDKAPVERFQIIARAIGNIGDQAQRAAAGQEIFGKSSAKLAELTKDVEANFAKARSSGWFNEATINKASDAWENFGRKVGGAALAMKEAAMVAGAAVLNFNQAGPAQAPSDPRLGPRGTSDPKRIAIYKAQLAEWEAAQARAAAIVERQKQIDAAQEKFLASGALILKPNGEDLTAWKRTQENSDAYLAWAGHWVDALRASNEEIDSVRGKMNVAAQKAKDEQAKLDQRNFDFVRGKPKADVEEDQAWRSKDPTADPRVSYQLKVSEMMQDNQLLRTDVEIRAEAARQVELERRWANPNSDPRLTYEERVAELIKANNERNAAWQTEHDRQVGQARVQAYSDTVGNLAAITEQGAKQNVAMFYINKALQMVQAEMNAWIAYSNTMAAPSVATLGPTAAAALAGSAFALSQVAVSQIASQEAPGRAIGGPVSRNTMYRVNEDGPELLSVGKSDYLMMGSQGGHVTSNSDIRGGGSKVELHIHNAPGTTSRAVQSGTQEAPRLDVFIEAAKAAVAADVASGTGPVARAGQRKFGWNGAKGAG